MDEQDIAKILSELPTSGTSDYVTQVMEIYRYTMTISEPAERSYWSAVEHFSPTNGFSASTNG